MMNNSIVTLTMNPALDVYLTVPKIEADIKMQGDFPRAEPGGGGINVSRAIAKLGGKSTAIFTHGGYIGDGYSLMLALETFDQLPVWISNNTRQNFVVREESTGCLYRFGTPGHSLTKAECHGILEKIRGIKDASYFVASGSLPEGVADDFYAEIAGLLKESGTRFILDTSGKPLAEILKTGAYLIKPNKGELEALAGHRADSEEEQREALRELINSYDIEVIVLSLGPKGALLATNKEIQHFSAPQVEQKSSVGAGDSMVAGIVHSLSQGKSLEEAALFGLACGSAAIMTPGTELLRRPDAERLYEEMLTGLHTEA